MDEHPQLVAKKCSQVGWTEFAIATVFSWSKQGIGGMYILPSDMMRTTFVSNRIDGAIRYSNYYREYTRQERKDTDSRTIKTLFGKNWKFSGSNSKANFYEFPAGATIEDEYDLCDQDNLIFLADRLRAQSTVRQYKFGNPTLGDRGITVLYENSDKRSWHIKCTHCGERQPLDWFVNVVREVEPMKFVLRGAQKDDGVSDVPVVCRKCSGAIDRLASGEWVAENRASDVHGYHVNGIFGDFRRSVNRMPTMRALYREFVESLPDPTKYKRFMNNILGVAYAASDAQITEQILARCVDNSYHMPAKAGGCVAGTDINLGLHTIIRQLKDNRSFPVWIGQCTDWSDLASKYREFGVTHACIDAGPEIHAPREFVRDHPGCYLVRFNKAESPQARSLAEWRVIKWETSSISVNRTEACDRLLAQYLLIQRVLPKNYLHIDNGEFASQLRVPTRVKDIRPDKTWRWIWTKGKDHYFFADLYCMIAESLLTEGPRITVLESQSSDGDDDEMA